MTADTPATPPLTADLREEVVRVLEEIRVKTGAIAAGLPLGDKLEPLLDDIYLIARDAVRSFAQEPAPAAQGEVCPECKGAGHYDDGVGSVWCACPAGKKAKNFHNQTGNLAATSSPEPAAPAPDEMVERVALLVENGVICRACNKFLPDGRPPTGCTGRCSLDLPSHEQIAAAIRALLPGQQTGGEG